VFGAALLVALWLVDHHFFVTLAFVAVAVLVPSAVYLVLRRSHQTARESTLITHSLREAEKRAHEIVNAWAIASAAVSWLPGSNILVVIPGTKKMISDVAGVFEVSAKFESDISAMGASVAIRMLNVEMLSFFPIAGWAVKGAIVSGILKTVGNEAIQFMKDRSPLID
jgi:hypothetical protein